MRDTGPGIPPVELPLVFERFHRVKGTEGRTHEGSGIGLALVRDLVLLHGGSIGAESVLGVGSAFTVTIPQGKSHLPADRIGANRSLASTALGAAPYVEEAKSWLPAAARSGRPTADDELRPEHVQASTSQPSPPGHSDSASRPRILWADDNADMRDYVGRLLADRFDVEAVANGREALDAAQRQLPDLVLSDVMMPGLDGFGLLRELRADERTRTLPVVLLSARAGDEARVEGLVAGADDYLMKPFSARELLTVVGAQIAMARMRRETEAQLRQARKMEALGTLTGGVAHEFNNILSAIIGFTELLAGHAAKGSRDERHLARIMEASIRGRDIVRQLLTFMRKTEQEKKPLRLSSIVKETVKFLRASTPSTIDIRVDVKSESGVILGDPVQIQQVLMNLCTNAAFAMREKGGSLDIALSDFSVSPSSRDPQDIEPGLYIKLTVRDTGSGIAPEIIDKIFDPFFTTKEVGEGTGLGLSVVHGIVKQHDGYITVESEPGKGSTFTVYFPKTAKGSATASVSHEALPTGSERILFVDDEEALVEMGEDILTELGYEVTSRMNGKEALALLKEDPSRFDLVITDQTMPEMTGVELAKEVLALRADLPIIMCTGFSHLVDADKANALGIPAFAMKPLTKAEIAKTIRKVLDEQVRLHPSSGYR
ncbi:MAG: response regulator [Syntrophorhabdales bacterium]